MSSGTIGFQFNQSVIDPLVTVTQFNIPFCDVVLGQDLFQPPAFQASRRLLATNSMAIRFGASNNMITLFEGTPSQQEKYLKGLVSSSLVMFCFFLLWCIVMLVFKCIGYRRCGFLCGRFIRPPEPTRNNQAMDKHADDITTSSLKEERARQPSIYYDANQHIEDIPTRDTEMSPKEEGDLDGSDDKEYQEWCNACQRQKVRLNRTSYVLVFSCLIIAASGILFCVYGTKYVTQTIDAVRVGLQQLQALIETFIGVVDNVLASQGAIANETSAIFGSVNTVCPNVRPQLCQQVGTNFSIQNCNFTGIPYVGSTLPIVFDIVYGTKSFVFNELNGLKQDAQDAYNQLEDMINKSLDLEWAFWAAFGFTVAMILCCFIIILGIWQARRGSLGRCGKWMRHQIVFPIFCILVTLALLFSILFTVGAIAASDWCIESPNSKVTYIINEVQNSAGLVKSIIFDFAKFYVNSCPVDSSPAEVAAQVAKTANEMQSIQKLETSLQSIDQAAWAVACGTNSVVLTKFVALLEKLFCKLGTGLEAVNRFLWCRTWNPVYTTFMYQAICFNAQEGLSWVAGTMFVSSFFAFIVLLLRAGAFDIEDEEEYLRNSRRCRVCCFNAITCACCRRRKTDSGDTATNFSSKQTAPVTGGEASIAGKDSMTVGEISHI